MKTLNRILLSIDSDTNDIVRDTISRVKHYNDLSAYLNDEIKEAALAVRETDDRLKNEKLNVSNFSFVHGFATGYAQALLLIECAVAHEWSKGRLGTNKEHRNEDKPVTDQEATA